MKKILSLSLLSLLLLGCNLDLNKKIDDSYKYDNKVKYTLPTEGYNNVEDFLNSINLNEYQYSNEIDYSTQYDIWKDLFLFKYDGMNIIMRNLNDYVCLLDKSDNIKEEEYYDIKLDDSIFEIIDRFGLPISSFMGNYKTFDYCMECEN